jgi:UDP-N-acetylmuramoyl-tripeptide--D-alanyl-D-alanine ligase
MLKILISVIFVMFFLKQMLFWFWLWQLKEYHFGRFRAHFESRALQKFIASYWRIKYPKFTKKMTVIFLVGFGLSLLIPVFFFSLPVLFLFFFLSPLISSLLILLFQIPTVILRNRIIKGAKQKRKQFENLLVIGITGSYGKTSTKEFLAVILAEKFRVLKTRENQNSEMGISRCILKDLKPEHEIFICEMGAYSQGGIRLLSDIVKPKIGILTGINEQHLATFGSQEKIIQTKYELIESLPGSGLAIFNGDNNYCFELYKRTKKPKRFYSLQSTVSNLQPDIWTKNYAVNKDFVSFEVFDKEGKSAVFKANLFGGQNILNLLAAACCAKELGLTLEEIAAACQKIKPEHGSIRLKKGIGNITLIDSTYSANPDGVIADLEYLNIYSASSKKIIVIPCLIELGRASKEIHRRIGRKIGQVCNLAIITNRDRFQEIGEGAVEAGMRGENILLIENPKEIFEKIKSFCSPGDVVLLEGRLPTRLLNKLVIK